MRCRRCGSSTAPRPRPCATTPRRPGRTSAELDELIAELDQEIASSGLRGKADPADPGHVVTAPPAAARTRQTCPSAEISPRTVGKTYTAKDGKVFRPSMFLTLTCPSYGRVSEDGTPVDPGSYDYPRAARDALHFAALFDRFTQNLRRVLGYDVQYFATIEPQRRLAPHVHIAMRGTISRAELRQIIAATYHQVWWPSTDHVSFDGDYLPVWYEARGGYLDPATGELLPTWDEALDAITDDDQPRHVARFGAKFDAQGVLAGSKDSSRCIGYLTKYLTKQLGDCHQPDTDAQREHVERLADALRYEPCSPTCANWLRYGIQPKNPRPGLIPGACKGKAHRYDHLGYAGRRVLVSRKWSGKTLADHRGDRQAWLTEMLGLPATDPARYRWEQVQPDDEDYMPSGRRLLRSVADRLQWETRPHRSQTTSPRSPRRRSLGNREGGVMASRREITIERHLTVAEVAELLGTTERFPRRLIAERRIRFVRVGRHVRIPESAVREFIAAGLVEPVTRSRPGRVA